MSNNNPVVMPIGVPNLIGLTTGQRAIRAARLSPTGSRVSAQDIAESFKISTSTLSTARYLITYGTPEEIALVEEGKKSLVAFTRAIKRRNQQQAFKIVPAKRRRTLTERTAEQQLRTQIWFQFKRGLTELAGLPAAADMAVLARQMDKRQFVETTLLTVISWLGEFEDEWTRP